MRILLVEDEENIRDIVKLNLELEGYETVIASNGKDALKLVEDQHFDLVMLDIMLPEVNGIDICQKIRLTDSVTPILFLSAKDSATDKIKGLKTGADDYITKPFNLEELLLRVQKLLQRSANTNKESTPDIYSFGDCSIDFKTYRASGINGPLTLTKKEVMLLKLLISKKNEVVSRNQILQNVWGYDVFPSTRTIDNFILNFRKYFEKDPRSPLHFHSIRSVGYKFTE